MNTNTSNAYNRPTTSRPVYLQSRKDTDQHRHHGGDATHVRILLHHLLDPTLRTTTTSSKQCCLCLYYSSRSIQQVVEEAVV